MPEEIANNNQNNEVFKYEETRSSLKVNLILSIVFFVLGTMSAIVLGATFMMNIALLSERNASIIAIIITLPIFIIVMDTELLFSIPAFVLSLTGSIKLRFKNPIFVILASLCFILVIFPVVLFMVLFLWNGGGQSVTSSISETVSSALKLFM